MDITKYYLDLSKISNLPEDERREIHHYYRNLTYRDMLNCLADNRTTQAISFFNTLENGGYLINIRDEKIDKVLS